MIDAGESEQSRIRVTLDSSRSLRVVCTPVTSAKAEANNHE